MKKVLAIVCLLVAFQALQAAHADPVGVKHPERRSLFPYFQKIRAKQIDSQPVAKIDPGKEDLMSYLRLLADMMTIKERYILPSSIVAQQRVHF